MELPVPLDLAPMEAETAAELPAGPEWQYEPKWDGFRCLAFRDGDQVELQSKSGRPLARYFPDVARVLRGLSARRFVLDGEIVVPVGDVLSFEELQLRLHPAASRVAKLAAAHPATLVAFDLLLGPRGGPLLGLPLAERRPRLEAFAAQYFTPAGRVKLSRSTRERGEAQRWLTGGIGGLDGVMAKRLDLPYLPGERAGMVKVKNLRTADCVVGGFRYLTKERVVGSLLLGLYDRRGLLHHVGFCSGLTAEQKRELTPKLEAMIQPPGFTGAAPGGPSRWSTERSAQWQPLAPRLVVEVQYDHFSGGRFRHGTGFVRWRPDKEPRECRLEQVERESRASAGLLG
ncbi:MAG TPA: ATP-dependent DNA ligase [Longimicrobiaceae bacterium]|nr:ATP-dependent DNA ligase [Longimicrobiaceae bacterium]